MKIHIEVGSNRGTDTDRFINDDTMVYCFEPAQELYYSLWQKYKDNPNVMVLPFAVDVESSVKRFNVQGAHDWGCSSLNEYNDNLDNRWPNRLTNEFIFTHSYNVFTIRLDQFIDLYNIKQIDYLWIDAQGHDFKVLQSLGEKIHIVKQGRCEVAGTCELYKNTDNTYQNVYTYLTERGFGVSGNPDNYECDLGFWKL